MNTGHTLNGTHKTYPITNEIEQQTVTVAERLKKEHAINRADSCDYCGRLAKRVRGIAVCPTCAGGW